jgi:hypothetical protein
MMPNNDTISSDQAQNLRYENGAVAGSNPFNRTPHDRWHVGKVAKHATPEQNAGVEEALSDAHQYSMPSTTQPEQQAPAPSPETMQSAVLRVQHTNVLIDWMRKEQMEGR